MLLVSYRHTWYGYSWFIYWLIIIIISESNEPYWELEARYNLGELFQFVFKWQSVRIILNFRMELSIFCWNEGFALGWNRWIDFGDRSLDSHWSSSSCSSLNISIYNGHLRSFQCSGFIMSEQIRQVFSRCIRSVLKLMLLIVVHNSRSMFLALSSSE